MAKPDEAQAVEHLIDRLAIAYPAVARPDLAAIVHEELRAFDQAPVRDFIPVLTERRAKARLSS